MTNNSGGLPSLLGIHKTWSVQAEATSEALICLSRRSLEKMENSVLRCPCLLPAQRQQVPDTTLCLSPSWHPKGPPKRMGSGGIWSHCWAWLVAAVTSKSLFSPVEKAGTISSLQPIVYNISLLASFAVEVHPYEIYAQSPYSSSGEGSQETGKLRCLPRRRGAPKVRSALPALLVPVGTPKKAPTLPHRKHPRCSTVRVLNPLATLPQLAHLYDHSRVEQGLGKSCRYLP